MKIFTIKNKLVGNCMKVTIFNKITYFKYINFMITIAFICILDHINHLNLSSSKTIFFTLHPLFIPKEIYVHLIQNQQ